jgi:hypothetical protein
MFGLLTSSVLRLALSAGRWVADLLVELPPLPTERSGPILTLSPEPEPAAGANRDLKAVVWRRAVA